MTARFQEPKEDPYTVFGTFIDDEGFYLITPYKCDRLMRQHELDKFYISSVEYDLEDNGDGVTVERVRVNLLNASGTPYTVKDPGLEQVCLMDLTDDEARWEAACKWLEENGEKIYRRRAA